MYSSSAGWQFQLFNYPVRVRWSFFLIAGLLGLQTNNLILVVLWVAVVFVSILLHELGHAIAADHYGRSPRIELYSMGGLTISNRYSSLTYAQEILISFAGPLAGFLLGGLVFLLSSLVGPIQNGYLRYLVSILLWVNIGWGIINLVPILPLDGGNIMRNLIHWFRSPYDERTPLMVSIVFGVLVIVAALFLRQIFLALLVGWLTFNNYQALKRGYPSDSFI